MKESLKDGLRAWVEGRGIQAQKRKADEMEASEKRTVKSLAKRFTVRRIDDQHIVPGDLIVLEKRRAQARWGRELELARRKEEKVPTRAHVLGLKRFWEGVIRTASS